MSMYLQYGNYQHALGECAVQIVRTPAWQHGTVTHIHEEWLISGRMQQSNSALLTLALEALQLGYSFNGQNIGLFFQGGTPTVHAINNINTLGGTKVLQSPTYEQGKGAEYSTFRNYTIRVGADICNPLCMLVFWKERINIRGGGPHTVYLELRQGAPQQQVPTQQTTWHATQTGEAVGQFSYPTPPPPIWPGAFKQDESPGIGYETPDRVGLAGIGGIQRFTGWRVTWGYVFESPTQLQGVPTMWPM